MFIYISDEISGRHVSSFVSQAVEDNCGLIGRFAPLPLPPSQLPNIPGHLSNYSSDSKTRQYFATGKHEVLQMQQLGGVRLQNNGRAHDFYPNEHVLVKSPGDTSLVFKNYVARIQGFFSIKTRLSTGEVHTGIVVQLAWYYKDLDLPWLGCLVEMPRVWSTEWDEEYMHSTGRGKPPGFPLFYPVEIIIQHLTLIHACGGIFSYYEDEEDEEEDEQEDKDEQEKEEGEQKVKADDNDTDNEQERETDEPQPPPPCRCEKQTLCISHSLITCQDCDRKTGRQHDEYLVHDLFVNRFYVLDSLNHFQASRIARCRNIPSLGLAAQQPPKRRAPVLVQELPKTKVSKKRPRRSS